MKLYESSLLMKLEPPAGTPAGTPKQPLPVDVAMDYGLQLAKAVAQLHMVGIKIGDRNFLPTFRSSSLSICAHFR